MKSFVLFVFLALALLFCACSAFDVCEGETWASPAEVDRDAMTITFRDLPEGNFGSGYFRAVSDFNVGAPGSVEVTFVFGSGEVFEAQWQTEALEAHANWRNHYFSADDLTLIRSSEEIVISSGVPLTEGSSFTFCTDDTFGEPDGDAGGGEN